MVCYWLMVQPHFPFKLHHPTTPPGGLTGRIFAVGAPWVSSSSLQKYDCCRHPPSSHCRRTCRTCWRFARRIVSTSFYSLLTTIASSPACQWPNESTFCFPRRFNDVTRNIILSSPVSMAIRRAIQNESVFPAPVAAQVMTSFRRNFDLVVPARMLVEPLLYQVTYLFDGPFSRHGGCRQGWYIWRGDSESVVT